MKIAVIGAGIIGVTTAYELARRGHEVEVFERHGAVAEGSSFANAGVLAPGYVTPWAAPGMPGKVLRYLLQQHAPFGWAVPAGATSLGCAAGSWPATQSTTESTGNACKGWRFTAEPACMS